MTATFSDVKKVLDRAIEAWKHVHGRDPRLEVHGNPFGWSSRDELLSSRGFGFELIQPELIGVPGRGRDTNLVIALTDPNGVFGFGRMPEGGPFIADEEVATIVDWIESGAPGDSPFAWRPTNAPVAGSRTDDIWFFDPLIGWAVNSDGKILFTENGGDSWRTQKQTPAYLRCIGFAGRNRGWVGTLSPAQKLFTTRDGGQTWDVVPNLPANPPVLCGLSAVSEQVVYASGTNFPNQPCGLVKTVDGGANWTPIDMQPHATLLVDCLFLDEDTGWVVGGKADVPNPTRADVKPVVLHTSDGGQTWENRVAGIANELVLGEWGWKIQFLNESIGFVSLESLLTGAILRTDDGGASWRRLPINDPQGNVNLEGVGFVSSETGWVGGWGDATFQTGSSSETRDGGESWSDANHIGRFLNRFRFFGDPISVGYASGDTVYKYSSEPVVPVTEAAPQLLSAGERRFSGSVRIPVRIPNGAANTRLDFWDRYGAHLRTISISPTLPGPKEITWDRRDAQGNAVPPGPVIYRVTIDGEANSRVIWLTDGD